MADVILSQDFANLTDLRFFQGQLFTYRSIEEAIEEMLKADRDPDDED